MRALICTLLLLTLAACATQQNYTTMLDTWMHKDSDQLVDVWGPPDNVYERGDKNRILTYYRHQTVPTHAGSSMMFGSRGFGYGYGFNDYSPITETRWCKTSFLVNKNRAIVNYRFEGDNCFISEDTMMKLRAVK